LIFYIPCSPEDGTIGINIKFMVIHSDMMHGTGHRVDEYCVRCPNDVGRMTSPDNDGECLVQVVSKSMVLPCLTEKHVHCVHLKQNNIANRLMECSFSFSFYCLKTIDSLSLIPKSHCLQGQNQSLVYLKIFLYNRKQKKNVQKIKKLFIIQGGYSKKKLFIVKVYLS